jgi:hypothetical protein
MEAYTRHKKGSAPLIIIEVRTISELNGIIVAAAKAVKNRNKKSISISFKNQK